MIKCHSPPSLYPRRCSWSLQGVQSSEGRPALPLMPTPPAPPLRTSGWTHRGQWVWEWRVIGSSLPSWRRKSVRGQEMRGRESGDTGSSPLPSFLGETEGQCARRFPSTKQLQGGSSWKGLQFSRHDQQSPWPLEHCGLASLPFFLVILHLKTATPTLTPCKEGIGMRLHLRKLTAT